MSHLFKTETGVVCKQNMIRWELMDILSGVVYGDKSFAQLKGFVGSVQVGIMAFILNNESGKIFYALRMFGNEYIEDTLPDMLQRAETILIESIDIFNARDVRRGMEGQL